MISGEHPVTPAALSDLLTQDVIAALVLALIALNFVTFIAFGIDKARAEDRARRIAESTLLTFALLGGTLGAYAGRRLFRHKTRKQPFGSQLFTIAAGQMLALGALLGWWLSRPT